MIKIPGAGSAANDGGIPAGTLTMYENDGTPLLAVCVAFRKSRFLVVNERGREVELDKPRLHLLPGTLPASLDSNSARAERLTTLRQECQVLANQLSMEEIWSFVSEDPREYTTAELVTLYYGKPSLNNHLAMQLALLGDRVFFKRTKDGFTPRTGEGVEELRKAETARDEKIKLRERTIELFRRKAKEPDFQLPPELDENIELLSEIAVSIHEIDNSRHKDARELLDLCSEALHITQGGSREQCASEILERIGYFNRRTNFALLRNKPIAKYSAEALKGAQEIKVPNSIEECAAEDASIRRDLTSLKAFTIDDASTQDMDDAISLEYTHGGYRLGVHISDVASLITDGTALDLAARARATSVYLPDQTINMLPDVLSSDRCSLRKGEVRPTISYLFTLDQAFNILDKTVTPALIKVDRRLSYDEVDELLERSDPEFELLYNLTSHFEALRISDGAQKVQKRDLLIHVDPVGSVSLKEIDEHGPARGLIGETAVLANALMAEFGAQMGIPLVFRGQEAPDQDESNLQHIPEGPALDYAIRARLKRSTIAFKPIPHSSLGLQAYTQASSPIRRYIDLCNQRQVLNFFRHGSAFYSEDQLREIVAEIEVALSLGLALSKESRRFWLLRYLEARCQKNNVIEGTVIRTDLKNPLVELEEVYFPAPVKTDQKLKAGDRVQLKITRAEARADYLKLELAAKL